MSTLLTTQITPTVAPASVEKYSPTPQAIKKEIARRSWCTLSTASADGKPHVVVINYSFVNGYLYFVTGATTKKARNIRENPNVAVCIPARKLPVGPPFAVQFQGTVKILSPDDPEIAELLQAGKLKNIMRRVTLEKSPDGCFLRMRPSRRVHTFGLGIPLHILLRDVTRGHRTVLLNESSLKGKGGPQ